MTDKPDTADTADTPETSESSPVFTTAKEAGLIACHACNRVQKRVFTV